MKRKSTSGKYSTFILTYSVVCGLALSVLMFMLPILKQKPALSCANSISCENSLELQVDNNSSGIFENQRIDVPPIDLSKDIYDSRVFGIATSSGEKHIYVDLTGQTLYAKEGDTLYMQARVSTGKWGRTPTGEFTIWSKVRSTRMTGGSGSDYYNLPNVPFVMFFSNDEVAKSMGFSFHGAYWHNNFGHPMSHGCINMREIDARQLYEWADPPSVSNYVTTSANNPGTKVTIYGTSQ